VHALCFFQSHAGYDKQWLLLVTTLMSQETAYVFFVPPYRDELQEQIAELEVEVAGIAVNNPHVVQEYMKRKAEIERLAADLAAQRAELDSLHTEIEQLKVRCSSLHNNDSCSA
jgi:chromosome segregation ATPase